MCLPVLVSAVLTSLQPVLAAGPSPAAGIVTFLPSQSADAVRRAVSEELTRAGYAVRLLDADFICDPARMGSSPCDLLVIPEGGRLPSVAGPAIEAYLRSGGDILALRTPLWQEPLIRVAGEWTTPDAYSRSHAGRTPDHVLAPMTSLNGWQRSSNNPHFKAVYELQAGGEHEGPALHVRLDDLHGWDTYLAPRFENPFPPGHTLTVLTARGGPRTDQLALEWRERDGSRWIAVAPLTPEWRQIVLSPADFKPWPWTSTRAATRPFTPSEAVELSIGLAFSHTGQVSGAHEYWVGPVGTAKLTPELEGLIRATEVPKLDTLSPGYKLFPCSDVASLGAARGQVVAPDGAFPLPASLRSPQPRPQGHGFDKGRAWRWIPLLEARTASGEWRGTPATLLVHADGPYKGGVWASIGVEDPGGYTSEAVCSLIRNIAERRRERAFLVDGGAQFYTFFNDQPVRLGATVVNLADRSRQDLAVRVNVTDSAGKVVHERQWTLDLAGGEKKAVSEEWTPPHWAQNGYTVTAELLAGGPLIDRVSHEIHVWRPRETQGWVTAKNGGFSLDGRPWRAHGVNYMPSSGIGTEDGAYFEHWVGARSYDPVVIQRDLEHIRDLGMNAVSIFIDHVSLPSQNLLDLLRRLDALGMKANLSLRPGNPMHFDFKPIREIIEYYRLAENDTVFAFDLAWEPMFRGHQERKPWDRAWEAWILERYGSIDAAEKDWGFALPREADGRITNPLAHQVDTQGDWRRMTAAYRRFLDTILYQKHAAARRLVRTIAPHQFVSFRMAEAGNPTMRVDGWIPYDFPYLALGVDMLAPEAYGRIGDWEQVKPGMFEIAYARWAAPDKPVIWAEAGVSAWDATKSTAPPSRLQFQADHYRAFYRMLIASRSDGVFFWWYPGGYRVGEASDFGIINPDGSDRLVTRVIREHARSFLDAPAPEAPNAWIEFDRDAHPDGIAGVYDALKDRYWQAMEDGRIPGLRTTGTGTTSADCPLTAVGNTPCTGTNPPKYLDGSFDLVEVRAAGGEWRTVEKGSRCNVPAGRALTLRLEVANVNEATWLPAAETGETPGSVSVLVEGLDTPPVPIPARVARGQTARLEIPLLPITSGARKLTLALDAKGRTRFGERYGFELAPE